RDVRWQRHIARSEPNAIIVEAEGQLVAESFSVHHVLNGSVGGDIHALERARDDRTVGVLLVSVNADAVDALLACRLQGAKAATPGHLEDDLGTLGDLVIGD